MKEFGCTWASKKCVKKIHDTAAGFGPKTVMLERDTIDTAVILIIKKKRDRKINMDTIE